MFGLQVVRRDRVGLRDPDPLAEPFDSLVGDAGWGCPSGSHRCPPSFLYYTYTLRGVSLRVCWTNLLGAGFYLVYTMIEVLTACCCGGRRFDRKVRLHGGV